MIYSLRLISFKNSNYLSFFNKIGTPRILVNSTNYCNQQTLISAFLRFSLTVSNFCEACSALSWAFPSSFVRTWSFFVMSSAFWEVVVDMLWASYSWPSISSMVWSVSIALISSFLTSDSCRSARSLAAHNSA